MRPVGAEDGPLGRVVSSLSSKLSPTATKGLAVEVGKTTSVLPAFAVISFLKSSGSRTGAAGGSALALHAGGPSGCGGSSFGGAFFVAGDSFFGSGRSAGSPAATRGGSLACWFPCAWLSSCRPQ